MWRAAGGQSDWFPSLCNATDIPAAVSVAASGGAREGSGWPEEVVVVVVVVVGGRGRPGRDGPHD